MGSICKRHEQDREGLMEKVNFEKSLPKGEEASNVDV